jgi:hypothetical protein
MAISPITNPLAFTNSQGMELTSHGSPLFPIAFYHDNLERERVPWHWHDELEAVYRPNMDFAALTAYTDEYIEKLFE